MRTSLTKLLLCTVLAGGLMASGAAFAQPAVHAASCSTPGVVKASVSLAMAETFIVPFAANSSQLSPVAERVLEIAAVSYPQQPVLYFRVQGAEPVGETETLVKIDRLAWITAYLAQRDVPLEAVVFEEPSMAQQFGCVGPNQASL